LAALDAAVRLVASLVESKAIESGPSNGEVLRQILHGYLKAAVEPLMGNGLPASGKDTPGLIPEGCFSVMPYKEKETAGSNLSFHGAVLIKVNGLLAPQEIPEGAPGMWIAPELEAILHEAPSSIEKIIWDSLRQDGGMIPAVLAFTLLISAVSVSLQSYLLQGLFRFQYIFPSLDQRLYALGALFLFLALLFVLRLPMNATIQRVGRRLETRMRIAFLRKIPRLSDRYFHSRLTSDMTSRAHGLRSLRNLPLLAIQFFTTFFNLILTMAGVIWLQPAALVPALAAMVAFTAAGLGAHVILKENDLRQRTHAGALSRFYLDALRGLLPLRTHSAERAFRREHEALLSEWMRSNTDMTSTAMIVRSFSGLLYAAFSAWIGFSFIGQEATAGNGLLLFYWTLNLPVYGQALVQIVQEYPQVRNSLLRILEPLDAPDENPDLTQDGFVEQTTGDLDHSDIVSVQPAASETTEGNLAAKASGVHIEMIGLHVVAGGHRILEDVNLEIQPGEHMAVIGPSGAGKSSLVGILLGWHKPAYGTCLVDGKVLEGGTLIRLRRETAWVDPEVHLWNKSLLENLTYGSAGSDLSSRGLRIEEAELYSVIERLENGMQTRLGEGGGLVSGGEGQRVRLARGMNRENPRLVILDEPFRGLDRNQRRTLLKRARSFWQDATLITVTHDVGETRDFERVLVIKDGRIIEDAPPSALLEDGNSRYSELLKAEEYVRQRMWQSNSWRRLLMENGKLSETAD
jgi:ABC-type bacteriocin/lantibiotic exporter with double-glycine peptidase domain